MQYFFLIILGIFLYINFQIIQSDIRKKIIPNKKLWQLLLLLPLYYIYVYLYIGDVDIFSFFAHIFITLVVCFALYYFSIWWAGDAKYLLVLALFIPHIGVIPFIGNIAILTLLYLLLYFIYFYGYRCIFNKKYSQSLYKEVLNDRRERFIAFLSNSDWKIEKSQIVWNVISFFMTFLVLFTSLRLIRIYVLEKYVLQWENQSLLSSIIWVSQEYGVYIVLGGIIVIILFLYICKTVYILLRKFCMNVVKRTKLNDYKIHGKFLCTFIIFLGLMMFIFLEYLKDPEEIQRRLILIFSLYLGIYIIVKFFLYLYKVTFQIWEQSLVHINNLQSWEIVDKEYLMKVFWEQEALLKKKPAITRSYFKNIENPIDKYTLRKLRSIYKAVNTYHKKNKTPGFNDITIVKTLKTFAFGIYIFLWFALTYIFQDQIFSFMIENTIKIFTIVYQ